MDWSALLGRPRAVHIVWTRRLSVTTVPEPNYTFLFWRPPCVNEVRFAELNSSDIRGLSAMIARSLPYDTIRYILGATGQGRRQQREDPALPISWVDYVFIDSDEGVRAWLLSNPVHEDRSISWSIVIVFWGTIDLSHCHCGGTTTLLKMPSPIGLVTLEHLGAAYPNRVLEMK